jgi:agmatinase
MTDQHARRRFFLFVVLLLSACGLAQSAVADWAVPAELKPKIEALSPTQQEFITSGAIFDFVPEYQLQHEASTRETEAFSALIDDLLDLAEEMGYNPERDMGAAPLNLASRRFNGRTLPTPEPLRDFKREPGPFSVSRYMFPQSGVPTFGGAKVAIWPEDLVAGNVEVAIIGVPQNMSSGRRDAGNGPNAMRAMGTIAMPDDQSLVQPMDVLSVVDYGNFSVDGLSTERTVKHVAEMVAETATTGAVPMLVGGDTSMLYPGVKGVAAHHGTGSFGLLHFSAHADAERFGDHTISDRQAIFTLLNEGIIQGQDTIQVGMRGMSVDKQTLQWLRKNNVKYHTMAEINQVGFNKVWKNVLQEVESGPDSFFVSIDVSALDPGEMIAAGRIVSGGMELAQVTRAIRHVCATKDIVGFEITDLAPMMDLSRLSVLNANAVLNACLNGLAIQKAGLKPDYVHPLVLNHGK